MKKSQRFSNMHPDDAEEYEGNWNRDLFAEDLIYHTHKAGRSESRVKRTARRIHRKPARDMQIDNSIED